MTELPLLPVSSIGSLPKPNDLAKAEEAPLAEQDTSQIRTAQETAVAEWLSVQDDLGIDLVVDGEQYRRSMISYFLEGWGAAEVDPDPVWVLDNLYAQRAVTVRQATRPRDLLMSWFEFAEDHTTRPVKITITGPYTLRDWSFDKYHSSRREAVLAIAGYLREEVQSLIEAGVRHLQIDEPAYVTRYDQPDELQLAEDAMHVVVDGLPDNVTLHTHMCYGAFHEVYPRMLNLPAKVFCMELSHVSREMLNILEKHPFPEGRGMGFGVVDAQDPRIETVDEIAARIELALEYISPDQLWLNPDCGLQSLPRDSAVGKLRNLATAAARVRDQLGPH